MSELKSNGFSDSFQLEEHYPWLYRSAKPSTPPTPTKPTVQLALLPQKQPARQQEETEDNLL